jgi:hypothetical protein
MLSIKQTMKVPKDRELRITIPDEIGEDEIVEVTISSKATSQILQSKIDALKSAATDKLFMEDLKDTMSDFSSIDMENWQR